MKYAVFALTGLLFLLLLFYPVGLLICAYLGYSLILTSVPHFACLIGFLALSLCFFTRKGFSSSLFPFLLPASLVHSFFCILSSGTLFVILGSLLCVSCCGYLTFQSKRFFLRGAAFVLSGFLILVIGLLGFLVLIFGAFGHEETIQTLESPEGRYCAQVTVSDQGALGGNTLVEVWERDSVRTFLFSIEKKPQRVYSGPWSEQYTIKIAWQDENTLTINSKPYPIT